MTKVQTAIDEVVLLVNDAHGQYVPKVFVESFYGEVGNETHQLKDSDGKRIGSIEEHKSILEALEDCRDAENEFYWESWEKICNEVCVTKTTDTDTLYSLHQNGSLYAMPVTLMAELDEDESEEYWSNWEF